MRQQIDEFIHDPMPPLLNGGKVREGIGVGVHWTLKERQNGLWVVMREFNNLVLDFGLTGLASAPSGAYIPPLYLVIETSKTTMSSQANAGTSSAVLVADPTIAGDTQLVLSVGLAAEEVVTFNNKSGTGPFTFTLTGNLAFTHPAADPVVRAVRSTDSMTSVLAEAQYDPTFDAGNRVTLASSFSPGVGQGTSQFFLAGITATNVFFAHVGMADARPVGASSGHLHNYAHLGYSHTTTNDIEIDVAWTLQRY